MLFTTAAASLHTVEVTGPEAEVIVRTQTGLTEAVLEITGLPEGVEAEVFADGGIWRIELPRAGGRSKTTAFTGRGGGCTVNHIGDVHGGQVLQAGNINGSNIQVGGGTGNTAFDGVGDMILGNSGPVHTGSGVQINNTVQAGQQRITVVLLIPSRVDFMARIDSGKVDTFDADLDVVDLHTGSGDVLVGRATDVYVHSSTGDVDVSKVASVAAVTTRTGRIDVVGGAELDLTTYTGDIRWSATGEATITARSKTGNIIVRSEGHPVRSHLKSHTGRVREA